MKLLRNFVALACAIGAFFVHADPVKIRLQFAFDAGAMDYISQAGANYDDFAASCVTRMNTVLANSRLNGYFTYELAGTTLLPGVDNSNPATGYTEGWAALCGNRGSEWAGMLQDRYNNAADVVVLLINTGTYAGATGNSHPYTGTGAEYAINYAGSAFSVCSIMTAAREIEGIASAHQVVSHEVAHTIGCGHPDTQDRQPGPQSATYASGLQFKLPAGKETALPRSASVTSDLTAYYGTTLMGYSERFFKHADGTYMTRAEVLAETGWTDADEETKYWDNTDGNYGTSYPNGVWAYCYIVPYFSSPDLYFSTVTVPYGQEVTSGVVTVYDQTQYDAMSAEDKAKVVPMGDATHNNRQVLIDNCQYASKWHLGVKFSKDGSESVVNGKSDKITLTPLSKNLTIYYTTDGTEPTKSNGTLYTKPFSLTQAATVKARSYDSSDNAGDVLSKSYTMLPLATALGNTELTWDVDNHPWFATEDGAQSGNVWADNGTSTLSTTVLGEGTVSFDYQLIVGFNDMLTVKIDGQAVTNISAGTTDWQSAVITITGDTEHTLDFTITTPYWFGDSTYAKLRNISCNLVHVPDPETPEEPDDPGVAAPIPVAVWDGDFNTSPAGYTLIDWNETHGENNSSVTIDRDNQGLFVDFAEAKSAFTVLVKYSDIPSASSARILFSATANSEDFAGNKYAVRLRADRTVVGMLENAESGSASTGAVPSSGTLALVYDKVDRGVSAYVADEGEALSSDTLLSNTALKGDDIHGIAVGGNCRGSSPSPATKGMTITGLAVFTSVLSVAEMNAYVWPSEEPEAPQYEGPAPTAVWVAGEFGDDRSAHAGLEVSLNGNTTNALGQIVIANAATLGATIALPAATHQKMSMLVKYSVPSGGASAANAVPASMFSTYDLGARAAQAASSVLDGYWLNGSTVTGGYDFSTPAQTMPQEGYVFISNWADGTNPDNHGTAVYTGETLSTLSGGEKTGLRFTGADHYITSVGIGGPTVAGAVPWAGMVIESVALFDEWVTTNVIANYTFPAQGAVQPVDTDRYAIEPVVSWVNDFKTTTKGDYTLSVSGTTAAKDDTFGGTLTIGNAAAVIDIPEPTRQYTMLIKYAAAPAQSGQSLFAGGSFTNGANKVDIGVLSTSVSSSALIAGYENTSSITTMALGAEITPSSDGGYILIAHNAGSKLSVYSGDTFEDLAETGATIDYSFTNWYYTKLAVGGPTGILSSNKVGAWNGLVVEKVVVFNGYYTPDQIRYVPNPEDADTINIAAGVTWTFTASDTSREYTSIGTLNQGGAIAIANASELSEGVYPLATWTTPQIMSSGYGRVGTLTTEGLPAGLTAELVYGVKAIYLRVYDAAAYAARPKLRILPYGDSITEGFNLGDSKANYRVLLGQKLAMLGYNVEMVGCYNKIQSRYGTDTFFDAIDPSGVAAPAAWQWHSAKHGATLGVTALTSYQRSALTENVDTICAQAGRPDAVLLLGGINDLSPGFDAPATVFANWTNVVTRLVNNLPDSKIVVTTTLHAGPGRTDSLNSNADGFNTLVKNYLSSMPAGWVGHVEFVDLCDVVKSAETGVISNDNLHPDWLGDDQMAEGWLSVITNVYKSVNGTFPSATPLPAVAASELGAAAKDELADYIDGFKLCRTITPTANIDTSNPYSATGEGATEDFEKVAYFVEYVREDNNAHKWVWVDMDAFGDADLASVGLPAANRQQVVTKLHVKSNHNGIEDVAADDDTVSGWIEFSPFGYGGAASGVSGAPTAHGGNDKSMYDWNDTLSSDGTYGSMQVFRTAPSTGRPAQVLFAYNNWRDATSEAEFGIGNFAQHFWGGAQTLDYTYTKGLPQMNAAAYSVKRIEIWTKTAEEGTIEKAEDGPTTLAVSPADDNLDKYNSNADTSADYGMYRIPALAKSTNGVLVALYDCRYTGQGDLPKPIDLAENWSGDNGDTWTVPRIGIDVSNDMSVTDKTVNIGDACILFDPAGNKFWAMGITGGGLASSHDGSDKALADVVLYTRGVGKGDKWTEWTGGPQDNERSVKQMILDSLAAVDESAESAETKIAGILQGPGHGIVQRQGNSTIPADTLIFPMQYFSTRKSGENDWSWGSKSYAFAVYSTDGGATWQSTKLAPTSASQENSIVELDDGSWLMIAKCANENKRFVFRTTDYVNWTVCDALTPSAMCQGSALWLGKGVDGKSRYVACFATENDSEKTWMRRNITLHFGIDDSGTEGKGIIWDNRFNDVIHPGDVGEWRNQTANQSTFANSYSSLVMLDDHTLGILLETNGQITFRTYDVATILATKLEESAGPIPTAMWTSGEFGETKNGYAIALNGNTTNDVGNIVIGNATTLGATIGLGASEDRYKASMLVKYALPEGGAPAANAALASTYIKGQKDNNGGKQEYEIGSLCATAGETSIKGYWSPTTNASVTGVYDFNTTEIDSGSVNPTAASGEGYLLFSFWSDQTSGDNPHGTLTYIGDSIASLEGGHRNNLQWRNCTNETFAIGGSAISGGAKPWAGMEIKSVALFVGEWFMPGDLADFAFPEPAEEPEEPENPDERDLTPEEIAGGNTFTRLNGKVYCGNDANRTVITNYLSQMEGSRPLTPPAPSTVDLLLVYDKPTVEFILNKGVTLEEFGAKNVAKMNYVLSRTDIDTNVWFRIAGILPLEVAAANPTDAMAKGQQSSAPGWEMVHAARDRVGADVVICVENVGGGMAYRCSPGGIMDRGEAAWAYSGVYHGDDTDYGWAWVHEVGHLASLYHNVNGYDGAIYHNDSSYPGCGFGRDANGRWFSSIMNYGDKDLAFSSANHLLAGELYSTNVTGDVYLDSTGVLAELLPYMADYRATVVPEGVVVNATPQDEAIVASGATMTLSCNDPEATIYYYNATLGETEANAVEYSAPVAITPGNPLLGMAQYYVFAKKNGVKVTAADAIIDYKVAGSMLVPDNPADILDTPGLSWSVGDGWTKTTEQSCKGGSAYVCDSSSSVASSLKTTVTVDSVKTLVFHHIDNFAAGASFVVWVDNMPVWYKNGEGSTNGEWAEGSVLLDRGSHTIEFAFSGNGSTLYLDDISIGNYEPSTYTWVGDANGDGTWETGDENSPWKNSYVFANGKGASFPDTAGAASTVTVKGTVAPSSVAFTAADTAYTLNAFDTEAKVQITGAEALSFNNSATVNVPMEFGENLQRLSSPVKYDSAQTTRLELNGLFGQDLTSDTGTYSGSLVVGKYSTVVMNPGTGNTQAVGDFGKNDSYADSWLVVTNGTVVANGEIGYYTQDDETPAYHDDTGLFQHKHIKVAKDGVLKLATEDATGYAMKNGSKNEITVEEGGELVFAESDRLNRSLVFAGGMVTVEAGKTLTLYNNPTVTVTANSTLGGKGSLSIDGYNATITIGSGKTLTNGLSVNATDKTLTLSGSGTFVQAAGTTVKVNEFNPGDALLNLNLTSASSTTAAIVQVGDYADTSAWKLKIDAPADLPSGTYPLVSASVYLGSTLPTAPILPTLAGSCQLKVVDGLKLCLVVEEPAEKYTETDYPVPYSWFAQYDVPENFVTTVMNSEATGRKYKWWECYVLGLDPTNAQSKFIVTIRMDGTKPVVEYAPTNEVLKASGAIEYILQGKPLLSNDWQDVEFDEPGDTNRFFQVEVRW